MMPTEKQIEQFVKKVRIKTGESYDQVIRRYPKIVTGAYICIDEWQEMWDKEGIMKTQTDIDLITNAVKQDGSKLCSRAWDRIISRVRIIPEPEDGQEYWYFTDSGTILSDYYYRTSTDIYKRFTGNMFLSLKEIEARQDDIIDEIRGME